MNCSLLGCVDGPIRRDHSRGKSRHFDCFQFFWCQFHPAHHMHGAPESTINYLSSRLTVETDAPAQSILSEKNISSCSKHVPRIHNNFLAHCQAAFLAPSSAHNVLSGSLFSYISDVGVAMIHWSSQENFQRWFLNVDGSCRSFCVCES